MNIAFIGVGNVGAPLADRLQDQGHTVAIAARDPQSQKVRDALSRNPNLLVQAPLEAIESAEVVFLATPFAAIEPALTPLKSVLDGKILVDCTNPVGANLTHGLQSQISGSETVQQLVPNARVVKAFTIYGYENFEDSNYPGYGELKPVMLVAGNDFSAKEVVADLCHQLGWEPIDTGNLSMSLHLEHMTLLWINMARVQGRGAGFVWAMLQR
ncbi:NADPH-dependent F420 reductase [Pseudanabaena sp. PCC 6802]|uniref:NADPH-dependent F420 reductase n=1 Tax=Pseudanabaena sp. PCC 6802 TaxID=118173 RepID=UPI00034618D2|nr:NADPH-dependent F420 reductase [Pseudanabaena sp. PCC 6802]